MGCCGPKVVAGISCVIDIILAIYAFVGGSGQDLSPRILVGLFCLILAFSCFMVIFAGDNASLFLPFLVLNPVVLIIFLLICIFFVGLLLFAHPFVPYHVTVKYIIMLVVLFLSTALLTWFYFIIFRAYVELAEKSDPDNVNSEGYGDVAAGPTCCCGPCRARIETAIPVVALVGFLFQLNEAASVFIFNCNDSYCFVFFILGSLCLAAAIAYLVVVFAQRERNPSLFLPYLIIMPIVMIIRLLGFALMLFSIIRGSSEPGFYLALPLNIAFLFAISIFPALHVWFYSIIFRAYKKTKQQKSASFIANSSSRAEESRVGP